METIHSRATIQMRRILEYITFSEGHPSADDIYWEVRKNLPKISLGTVYRNLEKLVNEGKVRRFVSGENKFRFDLVYKDHQHIRCLKCDMVVDVWNVSTKDILKKIGEKTDFKISEMNMEITGICPKCRGK